MLNTYLKIKNQMSQEHEINIVKLRKSALQGNDLSKKIWLNVNQIQRNKSNRSNMGMEKLE